jgi:hypothetical protein
MTIVIIWCSVAGAQPAEVWIQPDTVYHQNNAFFRISLQCDDNLIEAKSFHVQLSINPAVLYVPADSVLLGSMFDGINEDSITVMFTQLWDDSTHLEVDIAFLRDSATIDGPGELLIFPVTPTGIGVTDVQITELMVFDRFNQEIPVTVRNDGWIRVCQYVGDIDANASIDIVDLVYLVEYMFQGGPLPIPNKWVGDFNCDGKGIDITDLIGMVMWMFQGGPWLCNPPCFEEP